MGWRQGTTADGSLGRMEDVADQRLAKAQAMAELTSQDLDSRFSDLESQSAVDTDLADLKKPDAVIFVSYTSDAILYTKTMKSLDYLPPVVIGDDSGFSDPTFI